MVAPETRSPLAKTIWWLLLFLGVGGTVVFIVIAIDKGLPTGREKLLNAWPVGAGGLAIVSLLRLRRLYREQPVNWAGFWHLRLSELFATSLLTGLSLTCFATLREQEFLTEGLPISFSGAALILIGFMVANRLSIQKSSDRILFAIVFGCGVVGTLQAGALLATLVVALCWFRFDTEAFHAAAEVMPDCWGIVLLFGVPAAYMAYRQIRKALAERKDAGTWGSPHPPPATPESKR